MFASYYFKPAKVENDYQPDCLTDDTTIDSLGLTLPKKVKLSSTFTMYMRNNETVLQYHKPNENLLPEDYTHHMLILYYPFFNESDLKLNNSYLLKNNNLGVLNIVNRNREIFEPASDIVDHYWVQIICKIEAKQNANYCLLLQVKLRILSLQILLNLTTSAFRLQHLHQSVDDVSLVYSLKVKQRAVFIVVADCPVGTCSTLAKETLEQGVKYVQS